MPAGAAGEAGREERKKMSNVYCRAMSVLGCQPAALKIRKSCTQDCCDGENCISWFDKQFSRLAAYEDSGLTPEQVQELAKAKADGRLKILPVKKRAAQR